MVHFIGIFGGLSLGVMFTIESGAWYVRAMARASRTGQMIAVSNIFLYSSRLFAFGFQLIVSMQIDAAARWTMLWGTFLSGFLTAATLHVLLFFTPWARRRVWPAILSIGSMTIAGDVSLIQHPRWRVQRPRLFSAVTMSASLFGLSATLPYLLARHFSGMRMTLGSVAQIINFCGSILLVYWVDPMLFVLMDEGILGAALFDYILGRLTAFLLFSLGLSGIWMLTWLYPT